MPPPAKNDPGLHGGRKGAHGVAPSNAVTDLSWQQIRADQLADAIREHWHVEVRREVALVE